VPRITELLNFAPENPTEGMKHCVEKVQEPEFATRDKGYTFVSHQREFGVGYFDDVTTVIQGGASSVTALHRSMAMTYEASLDEVTTLITEKFDISDQPATTGFRPDDGKRGSKLRHRR